MESTNRKIKMINKSRISRSLTFRLEGSFLLTVVRHGLSMMIPFILTGGLASALLNFPLQAYQDVLRGSIFEYILAAIYHGTYGIFSLAMLLLLCVSYCMERNMTMENAAMYLITVVAAFGVQLFPGGSAFSVEMISEKGCFFAIYTSLLACRLLELVSSIPRLRIRKYTSGMEGIYSVAISMLFPAMIVIAAFGLVNQLIIEATGVENTYQILSDFICSIFSRLNNQYGEGLLYTIVLHLLWLFGLHGSHILEPVATTYFAVGVAGDTFSKSFFDVFVVMGGCGTTICVLFILLFFFRKNRIHNIGKLAVFTVAFNLNEILTFGLPIILNPIFAIPFLLTPVFCYSTAYAAATLGLVPHITQEIPWSTPVFFSGYLATGSIRGLILQVVLIAGGICIYYPFCAWNLKVQEEYAKEQLEKIVHILKEKEEENETVNLLSRSDREGQICRVLCHDLKVAIEQNQIFMLFQPQVDANDKCIGAEALLRWKHQRYGSIYPPLIIYLAKEGGMLEALERRIIDQTVSAIADIQNEVDGDFKISMNLTAKSLLWDVESCIKENLKKYHVPATKLWIEITEQDVLSKSLEVTSNLEKLKNDGHVLMIDDFGMGHTSILYLQSNYFEVVKLDGGLIQNILESKTKQKIVSSIVELSDQLNIKVIAEYVESESQRDLLRELGCSWYQGYYYSRPVSLEELKVYMRSHTDKG